MERLATLLHSAVSDDFNAMIWMVSLCTMQLDTWGHEPTLLIGKRILCCAQEMPHQSVGKGFPLYFAYTVSQQPTQCKTPQLWATGCLQLS